MTSLTSIPPGDLAKKAIRIFARERSSGNKAFSLKMAAYRTVEKNQGLHFVDSKTVYEIAVGICRIQKKQKKKNHLHFHDQTREGRDKLLKAQQNSLARYNLQD